VSDSVSTKSKTSQIMNKRWYLD